MKILPPYGKFLSNNPSFPAAIIFLGEKGWAIAQDFQRGTPSMPYALFLPHKASPGAYKWPVRGRDVYLCDLDRSTQSFIRYFTHILFSFGANSVMYSSRFSINNFEKGISYEKK